VKEPLTWWRALEARDIAEGLIPEFHEHLAEATILYVFRSRHAESKGRIQLACVRKVTGLTAYLAQRVELDGMAGPRPPAPVAPPFFLMEIAWDTWVQLSGSQRVALVDHELSHIAQDGALTGHDVEEFAEVLARHGAWKSDLLRFLEAAKRKPIFESIPPRRERKKRSVRQQQRFEGVS